MGLRIEGMIGYMQGQEFLKGCSRNISYDVNQLVKLCQSFIELEDCITFEDIKLLIFCLKKIFMKLLLMVFMKYDRLEDTNLNNLELEQVLALVSFVDSMYLKGWDLYEFVLELDLDNFGYKPKDLRFLEEKQLTRYISIIKGTLNYHFPDETEHFNELSLAMEFDKKDWSNDIARLGKGLFEALQERKERINLL